MGSAENRDYYSSPNKTGTGVFYWCINHSHHRPLPPSLPPLYDRSMARWTVNTLHSHQHTLLIHRYV